MQLLLSGTFSLELLTFSEGLSQLSSLPGFSVLKRNLSVERISCCRTEVLPDCVLGTLVIPDQAAPLTDALSFAFYLCRNRLLFLADASQFTALKKLLLPEEPFDETDPVRFFIGFLESLLQDDMMFLQNFEKKLATIEESLLDATPKGLQISLLAGRRELLIFHAYYQQMLDLCEILSEEDTDLYASSCARSFGRLGNRIDRLYDYTQMLREYALQIREMQQAQIDLRQNDTMRILTVVSTIFFPLSLIAGWYGMNFSNMPELSAPYAYFILIGICVLLTGAEFWYFKKKGWF